MDKAEGSNPQIGRFLKAQEGSQQHGGIFTSTILLIVIPITVVLLILAIFLLVLMIRRFRSPEFHENIKARSIAICRDCVFVSHTTINLSSSPDANGGGCLGGPSPGSMGSAKSKGVQVFTYKELEVATNGFNESNVIGNVNYGVVYKGTLSDGTVAAIKMLYREGKQGERAFRLEVDFLSRLDSPQFVQFLGYCADKHHRLLAFEYMPNGSLHQLLHPANKHSNTLSWGTRLRVALDCAIALEYLHEYEPQPVIHHDFRCSNIMLDENFRAKVCNLGLAKVGSDKISGLISTRVLGTTGYLAPEYASTGKLTTKSDVYSYGIVLLELLTGRVPIDSKRPPGEHILVSWALPRLTNREKIAEMVDPVIGGQYSKKDLIQVAAIAAMCVQIEPDYRPLMTDVVQSLIPLIKNLSVAVPSSSSRSNKRFSPRF